MHYLGVFGQHGELHDLLGRFVEDLIPNDDTGSKLEGVRQDIAEFRNAGSRLVRERSEGSLGPGGQSVEYKINQESADERNHDESQGPRETTPGHLPGRYREEGARTSENEREQVERCLACEADAVGAVEGSRFGTWLDDLANSESDVWWYQEGL